ncbi:MAG TPA: glycoside hydrolase family 76 protein, partial [Candidatus Limnocylindrales bacterium]|nr:glycoside hydrolase family 76 protein [Candidatus Limnocylindrales bacterium]
MVLVEEYWDRRTSLFRIAAGQGPRLGALLPVGPWHYWWQAHALEVLLDGHEAGDAEAGPRALRLIDGITRRTHGDLTANPYYDDLAWMGLATMRAHALGLTDARAALSLAEAVTTGWDAGLGGVRWRVGDEFRNVAATAPARMLLARASQVDRGADQLAMARAAADWLHATLVDASGIVWDGCRPRGGVLVPEGRLWSYNVGSVAGLDVVLAGMSGAGESQR